MCLETLMKANPGRICKTETEHRLHNRECCVSDLSQQLQQTVLRRNQRSLSLRPDPPCRAIKEETIAINCDWVKNEACRQSHVIQEKESIQSSTTPDPEYHTGK